ncbi:MAG: helix-hairpin-helix domain-containing protein [Lachnospirales bacterium]
MKDKILYGVLAILIILIIGTLYKDNFKKEPDEQFLATEVARDTKEINDDVSIEAASEVENDDPVYIQAYITGEVKNPGVYTIRENSRVNDLVILAGGFTSEANENGINLAQYVEDAEHVYVPSINEKVPEQNKDTTTLESKSENETGKININTATLRELTTLVGIGDAIGNNIINYRNENGGFNDIEEVKNVNRIGDKVFENIKDFITVQ